MNHSEWFTIRVGGWKAGNWGIRTLGLQTPGTSDWLFFIIFLFLLFFPRLGAHISWWSAKMCPAGNGQSYLLIL